MSPIWFSIGGWILTAIAAIAVAWALFRDRSRGRRRCPKCWYDLESTAGLTCPECGRIAASERALFRTRRRYRWACLGLAVAAAAQPLRLWPQIEKDGWASIVPLPILMHTLPVGGMDTLVGAELKRRVGMTARMGRQTSVRLSESTRAYMLRRARHGNVLARPIDQRWQRSYGEFLKSCSHAMYWRNPDGRITIPAPTGGSASVFRGDLAPAGAVLEEAVMSLATIPPELKEIRTRPIWPVGVHPTLEITVDDWWPANLLPMTEIGWTVTPGGESGTITASGLVTFPITSRGDVTVELVINILQTNPSFRERPPTVRTERRTVRYRTTDSVQDCVGTLRSDAFDRVLQTSLIFFLEGPQDCGIDSTRLAQHSGKDFGDLFTLGFGAVAEVIADGETIATHRIRWQGARQLFRMSRATAPSIEQQRKLIAAIDAGTARVRITSDPQLALSNLDADRIWVGAIEIPLSSPPPRGPAQRLPARK